MIALFIYLFSIIGFDFKLNWIKSKFTTKYLHPSAIYRDYEYWILDNENPIDSNICFRKIDNSKMYDTLVTHIGYPLYKGQMESVSDLKLFCGKILYTTDCRRIKTPKLYTMIGVFFGERKRTKFSKTFL